MDRQALNENDDDTSYFFSEIDRKVAKCMEERKESLNSTQKWIIRIYRQIIAIVENLLMNQSCWDAIGDRDIMCDLISADSYYSKREGMNTFAKKNDDKELLESISSILNSPASSLRTRNFCFNRKLYSFLINMNKAAENI